MWDWIFSQREWIFSGCGVAIISWVLLRKSAGNQSRGANSQHIHANPKGKSQVNIYIGHQTPPPVPLDDKTEIYMPDVREIAHYDPKLKALEEKAGPFYKAFVLPILIWLDVMKKGTAGNGWQLALAAPLVIKLPALVLVALLVYLVVQPETIHPPPQVRFEYQLDGMTLSLQDTSESVQGIDSRRWSFGDGGSSTLEKPSHTYIHPGDYVVRLTLIIGENEFDHSKRIAVTKPRESVPSPLENQPPLAGFTFEEEHLSVAFRDQSNDLDGEIVARLWQFGDGTQSTQKNPRHDYRKPGNYTVSLEVTDDLDATDQIAEILTVREAAPTPPEVSPYRDHKVTAPNGGPCTCSYSHPLPASPEESSLLLVPAEGHPGHDPQTRTIHLDKLEDENIHVDLYWNQRGEPDGTQMAGLEFVLRFPSEILSLVTDSTQGEASHRNVSLYGAIPLPSDNAGVPSLALESDNSVGFKRFGLVFTNPIERPSFYSFEEPYRLMSFRLVLKRSDQKNCRSHLAYLSLGDCEDFPCSEWIIADQEATANAIDLVNPMIVLHDGSVCLNKGRLSAYPSETYQKITMQDLLLLKKCVDKGQDACGFSTLEKSQYLQLTDINCSGGEPTYGDIAPLGNLLLNQQADLKMRTLEPLSSLSLTDAHVPDTELAANLRLKHRGKFGALGGEFIIDWPVSYESFGADIELEDGKDWLLFTRNYPSNTFSVAMLLNMGDPNRPIPQLRLSFQGPSREKKPVVNLVRSTYYLSDGTAKSESAVLELKKP